ncbi:MAG: helix-turn-helix domain-containing protein [Ruminococcus sp.]|nr:helix-turn-helix domain-containing protein [Ruminococcus sp.]
MDILINMGKNIRKFRKYKGYTQEKLAEKAGLSNSYISDIECGKINIPTLTLADICDALDVEIYKVFLPYVNN